MITKAELLMGRDHTHRREYSDEIAKNLDLLVAALQPFREAFGKPMVINSGWRPPSFNRTVRGAAPKSNHTMGLACDFKDQTGELREFVLANLELCQRLGLYFEDFRWTKGWVHIQCVPPASGKRIFIPYKTAMIAPRAWSGKYDSRFDGELKSVS